MKILIDARFYGLENAGLGRYTINLLDQIQRLDRTNHYFILLRKEYYDTLTFAPNYAKVLADIPHYSFKEQFEIPKIITHCKPDIVHFLHFNVPFSYNGKFIVTIHDMTMHTQSTSATNLLLPAYLIKRFAYKKVFSHAVKKSQKILVPSQFVKSELLKNFNISSQKILVTYEGVNKPSTTTNPSHHQLDTPYFLYVGNAYPHKNLSFVIKALTKLNISTPANFYIVSKYNKFTDKLQALVSKLNAQKFIKLIGFVPDENINQMRENAVAFIYPSLHEGFGLPGLEAMQSKTLLLASNIPVFKEIYGNHAIYFDPQNQTSLITAMKTALSLTTRERQKMLLDNKMFVARYSWPSMAKQTLEVYNSFK